MIVSGNKRSSVELLSGVINTSKSCNIGLVFINMFESNKVKYKVLVLNQAKFFHDRIFNPCREFFIP